MAYLGGSSLQVWSNDRGLDGAYVDTKSVHDLLSHAMPHPSRLRVGVAPSGCDPVGPRDLLDAGGSPPVGVLHHCVRLPGRCHFGAQPFRERAGLLLTLADRLPELLLSYSRQALRHPRGGRHGHPHAALDRLFLAVALVHRSPQLLVAVAALRSVTRSTPRSWAGMRSRVGQTF